MLLDKLDAMDKKAELTPLNPNELNLKHVMNDRLAVCLREEELNMYQRGKIKKFIRRRC